MKLLSIIKNYFLSIVVLFALINCGGPSGTPVTPSNPDEIKTGQFLDHAVEGLAYSTGSQSGLTNTQGEFLYKQGETITFSIGNIILGTVDAASMLTPMDLVPGATSYDDATVINILRLIQTLDTDNNPDNGIEISASVTSAAITALDFTVSTQEFENGPDVMALITAATSQTQLVDTKVALHHFQKTLAEIDNTAAYLLGGQVFGLNGTLVLQNNDGDDLSLSANDTFTFNTTILEGTAYNVTVLTQPAGQTCVVTNGNGSNVMADVTLIVVSCAEGRYTIGGNVSGLNGSVAIQNNGADDLTVSANGAFTFNTAAIEMGVYSVTVLNQPLGQICTVINGSGIDVLADVNSVEINCIDVTYIVEGNVSGLTGTVVLQNNGADDLTLSSNNAFEFNTAVRVVDSYNVTVLNQPMDQICTVLNGSGPGDAGGVVTVSIICSSTTFVVGGAITGLNGSITLQNNGADDLILSANATFGFATPIADGGEYSVTVSSQPAGQVCTVANATGTNMTADINNVNVSCVNLFTVGGNVSGLTGSVTLQNNGGGDLTLTANGAFTFGSSVIEGASFNITIFSQPTGKTCTVKNGTGNNVTSDITTVSVSCSVNTYTIGGNVTGLTGSVVLQNNSGDDITVSANGSFTFSAPVSYNGSYAVTVLTQPTGQTCSVTNGAGEITAEVSDVAIDCAVRKLIADIVYNECSLPLPNTASFLCTPGGFKACVDSESAAQGWLYVDEVTFLNCQGFNIDDPSDAEQLTSLGGIELGGNPLYQMMPDFFNLPGMEFINVAPNERFPPIDFEIIVNGLPLAYSQIFMDAFIIGGDSISTLSVSEDYFDGKLHIYAGGNMWGYFVNLSLDGLILDPIITQNCSFPANQNDITFEFGRMLEYRQVIVDCNITATPTAIGVSVSGLNDALVIQNNGGDDLIINTNGKSEFPTLVTGDYNVTILNQPLRQTCSVSNSSGSVFSDVPNIDINCWSTDAFTTAAPLSIPYSSSASTVLNGKIYVTGGDEKSGSVIISSIQVYDPVANSWGSSAPMPVAKKYHSSVTLNGKIYVTGGSSEGEIVGCGTCDSSSVHVYDPVSDSWSSTAPLPFARTNHISVALNGKLYLFGGRPNSGAIVHVYDPVADSWSTSAPLPYDIPWPNSVVLNGKIYAFVRRGNSSSSFIEVHVYDPVADSWSIVSTMPIPYGDIFYGKTVTLNGKLYVKVGYGTVGYGGYSSLVVYDPVDNSLVTIGNLPDYSSSKVEAVNGKSYMFGVSVEDALGNISNSGVTVYDPLLDQANPFNPSNIYSNTPNLVIPDNPLPAVATFINVADTGQTVSSRLTIDIDIQHTFNADLTLVLTSPSGTAVTLWDQPSTSSENIIGAFPTTLATSGDLSILNGEPLDGTWTLEITDNSAVYTGSLLNWAIHLIPFEDVAPLTAARSSHSSTVLNGEIFVFGGSDTTGRLSSAEKYNPVSNSWVSTAPIPVVNNYHSSVTLDGKIYVSGGQTDTGYTSSVAVYDPVTDSWGSAAPLPVAKGFHSSVALSGKIYVIGGFTDTGQSSTVDVYDPVTNSWSLAASLPFSRNLHNSVVLNGKIYVMGGLSSGLATSVDVYDPVTNSWSSAEPMTVEKRFHSSLVLNGKIYVTGGYTDTNLLSTIEVYDPVTNSWATTGKIPFSGIYGHTTEVFDGKYYMIGGSVDGLYSNVVKIYDPLLDF